MESRASQQTGSTHCRAHVHPKQRKRCKVDPCLPTHDLLSYLVILSVWDSESRSHAHQTTLHSLCSEEVQDLSALLATSKTSHQQLNSIQVCSHLITGAQELHFSRQSHTLWPERKIPSQLLLTSSWKTSVSEQLAPHDLSHGGLLLQVMQFSKVKVFNHKTAFDNKNT